MHRFFIPKDWINQDSVTITGEPLHQIGYVLRLKPTDRIIVLDNSGWEYEVEIARITKEQVTGKITSKKPGQGEPVIQIMLYQALLKSDKFELVLQKGVELGVTTFVPFVSERCDYTKSVHKQNRTLGKDYSGSRRTVRTVNFTHFTPVDFIR